MPELTRVPMCILAYIHHNSPPSPLGGRLWKQRMVKDVAASKSAINHAIGELRREGLIDGWSITPAGIAMLGDPYDAMQP